MPNIPGHSVLGFGFDVMKTYDLKSTKSQVFKRGDNKGEKVSIGGKNFDVPENITVVPQREKNADSQIFSSRKQVQEHFAGKAGISGSGFGFTGQFNASYSKTSNSDASYYYGLVEAWDNSFTLKLSNQGKAWLDEDFKEEQAELPDKFSDDNKEDFFAFFSKFGTHFVKEISLGGHLYYNVAIQKSSKTDEQKARANMKAEYEGVFSEVKATAEASWKKVDKEYAESRLVQIHAQGGNNRILEAVEPGYGTWKGDAYKEWINSLGTDPGVTGFSLSPISVLFLAKKGKEVGKAIEAYLNAGIIVYANRDPTPGGGKPQVYSTIICNGDLLKPPAPQNLPGFQIVLVEPDTHKVLMNRGYYWRPVAAGIEKMYSDIAKDVGAITARNYHCAVSVFGLFTAFYPPPEVAGWLQSCKAKLTAWKNYVGKTGGGAGELCYTFIGGKGPRVGATEDFRFDNTAPNSSLESTSNYFLYGSSLRSKAGGKKKK